MPTLCIVLGCKSRSNRDKVSFHAIPAERNHRFLTEKNDLSVLRRASWIAAISRQNLTESILRNQKVCSKHFITGKPAALEDTQHLDWIPSQHMGHLSYNEQKRAADVDEKDNYKRRKLEKTEVIDIENNRPQQSQDDQIEYIMKTGVSTPTALTLEISPFGLLDEESRDDKWEYYTGFKHKLVVIIFKQIEPFICSTTSLALSNFNQLLLTLIKLRLDLHFKDLARGFKISATTASTYFNHMINILFGKLKSLIIWPNQSILKTVPYCFKETFHDKTTVILDCIEILIERPTDLLTQKQCWSYYRHHHTIKFLIGITPQGSVCYISDAWGGCASDKAVVELSDFCAKIKPGDIILADKGFLIPKTVGVLQEKLITAACTKGKSQLHPLEGEETRHIAHVRVHVERIIVMLKNKFNIFKGIIPISMLKRGNTETEKYSMLDKTLIVCCALINLSPPIIPL